MNQTKTPENELKHSPSVQKLLECQRAGGYLFHGTSRPGLKVIKPSETKDTDPNATFNTDTAIFCSAYPGIAINFSIVPPRDTVPPIPEELKNSRTTWQAGQRSADEEPHSEVQTTKPLSWKKHMEEFTGYVYVIPDDESYERDKGSSQVKVKEEVVPVDAIPVNINDFYALGGTIEWK